MGGTIWAESAAGKGSTFHFSMMLPWAPEGTPNSAQSSLGRHLKTTATAGIAAEAAGAPASATVDNRSTVGECSTATALPSRRCVYDASCSCSILSLHAPLPKGVLHPRHALHTALSSAVGKHISLGYLHHSSKSLTANFRGSQTRKRNEGCAALSSAVPHNPPQAPAIHLSSLHADQCAMVQAWA